MDLSRGVLIWAPLRQVMARGDAGVTCLPYIGPMKPLRALLAPLALIATTLPAVAEKIPLAEMSAYLKTADFEDVRLVQGVSQTKALICCSTSASGSPASNCSRLRCRCR